MEQKGGGKMTELKPCPFCGGEAIIVNEAIRENVYGSTIKGTAIGCRNCECHMFYRNRELAIEAWNKRVPQTWTSKAFERIGEVNKTIEVEE